MAATIFIFLTFTALAVGLILYFTVFNKGSADGEDCSKDADCKNKKCGTLGTKKVCCPSGQHINIGNNFYCSNLPNGQPCGTADSVCASAHCQNGVCAAKAPPGGEC